MDPFEPEATTKAINVASNLLSYRPRSRYELQQALKRKGFEPGIIQNVLTKLEENQLIDDARFAGLWVQDRIRSGRRSRMHTRGELQQKGIDSEVIQQAISEYTDADEQEVIASLIEARQLTNRYDQQKDLYRYLASKGFNGGNIQSVLATLAN